jgi:hypothetical protein
MDLFNNNDIENLLPYDGTVNYYGKVLKLEPALNYCAILHKLQ